jgi:two-component system sensor histidine kinase RegB
VQLRWVAVCGQALTLVLCKTALSLELPYAAIGVLIAFAAASNVGLMILVRQNGQQPGALVPAVLTLDTLLFTGLLYFSGGPQNPFASLYVVHVAMAAVVLSVRWTWWFVILSGACYAALFWRHIPLRQGDGLIDPLLIRQGAWFSLALVTGVIAYFIGRVSLALRRREQQLTELRSLVARNERLASLTTLAAGAAHELGTPLGTIAVVARELERAASDRPAVAEDARLIRSQVDRCRGIIDRMSGHASEDLGRVEQLQLDELLESLRGDLHLANPDVLVVDHQGVVDMAAPRQDLIQALVPLIHNAVEAGEGRPVTLSISRAEGLLRFLVRDQGPGMSPDVLARVGEPFFTTKPPGEGTGLGLYVVRLFAERLGGQLQIDSALGAGTAATLEFPEPKPVGASA